MLKSDLLIAVIKCSEMTQLRNGQPIISSEPIPIYGTILTFKCTNGYHLLGSSKLECVDRDGDGTGDWSEKAPTCKREKFNSVAVLNSLQIS